MIQSFLRYYIYFCNGFLQGYSKQKESKRIMSLKNASILVIDDDKDVLTAVRLLLKNEMKEVVVERNPENIPALLFKNDFDVVLLDMNFNSSINTGNEGLFWLRKIKELKSKTVVIMITAYGDIDLAVNTLKEGAADFVIKPWHNEKLIDTIKEALQKKTTSEGTKTNTKIFDLSEVQGQSTAMQHIFKKIEKVAPTDANILLLGENGTGKDLIADLIQKQSLRNKNPFVKVDVGSLTESLFESELFGYKKGAFTDAREDRIGRFEAANTGTLFLNEIGNISTHQQAKLLTVLQNREVIRLGSNQATALDIRLICATNVSLKELADENRFRKDLIYRINTVEITLPPLRERKGDIALLANYFLNIYATKYFKQHLSISHAAINKMEQYYFPGNVRELQYTIERAVIMSDDDEIVANEIIFSPIENVKSLPDDADDLRLTTIERNTILKVIEKNNGNITKAAKELGLTRTALYRRLGKYDI
jgi:two-component system, NtrC family, response regulator HydG